MDTLKIFDYEGTSIRTVMRNGEPWWVLKDVCKVLDLTEPHSVAAWLDDDEKDIFKSPPDGLLDVPNLGLTIVNEPGLYSVILRYQKL